MSKFNFIVLIFFLSLFGCEKVIDVDLNDANPVLVIEALLTEQHNSAVVKISETTSYFNADPTEPVTGAVVKITDDDGREYHLQEKNGMYLSGDIYPGYNTTYILSVEVNGTIYQSASKWHKTVLIDSLSTHINEEYSVFQEGYNVSLYFHDPPHENNYYRLKVFLNGELENNPEDFIFFNDNNTNGKFVELRIRRKVFEIGDTVTYELQTLDKAAYEYFDAISELIDDNSAATAAPANPVPNFTNGALGCFSAYSSDEKTIIISK